LPWWLLPALLLITLAVYHPAWHGGILWDDDDHMTRADLQDANGLWRIWFDIGATQQYYPVVHSAFWVLNRIWGMNTLPYHLLNIGLHAFSAFLFAVILRRLSVSTGVAILSAAIFAVHPVHVESVAWMTELKNTMSGVWYLAAALVYLRFDRERRPRDYVLALIFFIVALLSKTVTASLPAALLVVFWWQRGRLDWRRDVQPLVPFFVVGLAGGLTTAWYERTYIGAQGFEYAIAPMERVLIAGRALWFYLASIVWPSNLIFMYPKWDVSLSAWWQYLFPIGALAAGAVLWTFRHRSRAPLAAALFFAGTLVPALGFVNVFPFRYTYVADHFQYLASLGIIAIVAAGLMHLAERFSYVGQTFRSAGTATLALTVVLCAPLGALTWHYSGQYVDAETLYRTTIDRNPECWMAYNNLGAIKLHGTPEEVREGRELIEKSVAINPDNAEARNNLGYALQEAGQFDEARVQHEAAIRLLPTFADAHNNLGSALRWLGRFDEAERAYREAIRLKPRFGMAYQNLGLVLLAQNRPEDAMRAFDDAFRITPDLAEAHLSLGNALLQLKRYDEALAQYRDAARIRPSYAEAHHNAGFLLQHMGRWPDAAEAYQTALRLKPDSVRTEDGLGYVLLRMGRADDARRHLETALRLAPTDASAHFNLANALLDLGRIDDSVTEYRQALKYESPPGAAETHNNLGIALAQLGRMSEAIGEFQAAVKIDPNFHDAKVNLARATKR